MGTRTSRRGSDSPPGPQLAWTIHHTAALNSSFVVCFIPKSEHQEGRMPLVSAARGRRPLGDVPGGAGAQPRVWRWGGEQGRVGWSLEMEEGSRGQGWKGPISPPSCPTSQFHIGGSMTQGWERKPAPKGSEVDSYLGNRGCSCSHRGTCPGTRSKAGRFCRGLLRSSCP